MSNVESSHVDVRALIQKLERSEKSIAFIQHEHGLTLGQLHEEMTRLQEKCSELSFRLTMNQSADRNDQLRTTINQLENEVKMSKDEIARLKQELKAKEKHRKDLEDRLIRAERKFAAEFLIQREKQEELENLLTKRAVFISQLTERLNRSKPKIRVARVETCRKDLAKEKLLNVRIERRNPSIRSVSTNEFEHTKILFIGRRVATPTRQIKASPIRQSENLAEKNPRFSSKQFRQSEKPNRNKSEHFHRADGNLVSLLPSISFRKVQFRPSSIKLSNSEKNQS